MSSKTDRPIMRVLPFDTLTYARRLQEAGVPKEQAVVYVELLAEVAGFNPKKLLTRDDFTAFLDARLAALEARLLAQLGHR